MSTIIYRDLYTAEELQAIVPLEMLIWNMADPEPAVPHNLMQALTHNGGHIGGAFDGDKLVGFTLAFPAKRGNEWGLWSHMAGVHPDYQRRNIGQQLKLAQRKWALGHGYSRIAWTFDPLQRGNAHFNLHLLGAQSYLYHDNFYGEMRDGINRGMPSDRLEVIWLLEDERVIAIANGAPPLSSATDEIPAFLLCSDEQGLPIVSIPPILDAPSYAAEIPYDINAIKRTALNRAIAWQAALGETLRYAFNKGYIASDFVVRDGRCWYILTPKEGLT